MNLSPKQMLRITIALACLIGLGGSVFLAAFLHDVSIFYAAGSSVAIGLFWSWIFDVWSPGQQATDAETTTGDVQRNYAAKIEVINRLAAKSEEVARKLAEVLIKDSPQTSTMTINQYQAFQNQLIEVIDECQEGTDFQVNQQLKKKTNEIARKAAEVLTNRVATASTMTVSEYQALQKKLVEVIQKCLFDQEDDVKEDGPAGAIKLP